MRNSTTGPEAPPSTALLEISWEVCNQVGGIYQVLRSKAEAMQARWGDRYLLIGPRVPAAEDLELEAEKPSGWVAAWEAGLREQQMSVSVGRWLVPGRPWVMLLDPNLPPDRIELVRHRLNRDSGVPPSRGNALIDAALGFGDAVRRALAVACERSSVDANAGEFPQRLLAHFHEWLGSIALPLVRTDGLPVRCVFTTHATSVGRYVASSGEDLYGRLSAIKGDREAERFDIGTQHAVERVCATSSDVFTTVSPITGEECHRFFGRAPDLVTPNGLNLPRFDVAHEVQSQHAQCKDQIHRFVMGHFFPSYDFDLDRTLYFFNAGRFEPRNKGFDLSLEAMARLNAELKNSGSDVTVVFFIVTSTATRSLDARPLRARGLLDDLEEVSRHIGAQVAEQLFRASAAGKDPRLADLSEEYWRLRLRRVRHAFRSTELPLLCTHEFEHPDRDPVLLHLAHLGLCNAADDPVKIVYHPEFISSVNPLWSMDYDQFVRGCHLGVFPSAYEPWGYTPLECLAMGVPSITSDLTGFGGFVAQGFPDHAEWGLTVLSRRGRSYHDAAADLTEQLATFCRLDRTARVALRNEVAAHSHAFDWSQLAGAYHDAHDRALAA